jgi:hypothetical protein
MVVVVVVGRNDERHFPRWMDGWMDGVEARQESNLRNWKEEERERESRVPFSRNETTFRPAKVGSGEMCAD